MKGNKVYRHDSNPKEKEFHDKFIKEHGKDMSLIVYPQRAEPLDQPSERLSPKEESIVITTIQWLGSPVGQNFLYECGFEKKKTITR